MEINQTKVQNKLSEAELICWLRLSRSENIGPLTFERLIRQFRKASTALQALPELAQLGGKRSSLKICSENEALTEIEVLRKFDAELLPSCDALYPPLLREIPAAPPLIACKGRIKLALQKCFAIVGARNASMVGKKLTTDLSLELGQQNWAVVSGLARGIDTCAHEATLATGTIAVLAGGIDNIYPSHNKKLYEDISEKGLLIAESPYGTQPKATLFPRRNRIISGLSQATLVVEAALKSGSLVTARYALEQGREVFAVPGSPLDPRARGTNHLIRQGAILTESYDDISRELLDAPNTPQHSNQSNEMHTDLSPKELSPLRTVLLENLSYTPIRVDNLLEEYHIPPAALWSILLELEIAGRLNRLPGGYISLKPKQRE